ncbi:MAG: hypothetical protein ACI9WU_000951 [Myxococcota bacterium]|jgi:hypothetical protein
MADLLTENLRVLADLCGQYPAVRYGPPSYDDLEAETVTDAARLREALDIEQED